MNHSFDPRARAAFDAAVHHVKTTTAGVAERVAEQLGLLATSAGRVLERDGLVNAQLDLRRNMGAFLAVFGETLAKKVNREFSPEAQSGRKLADTDWQSLSLVDDNEVEDQMISDRISQAVAHECEWELRELAAYTGRLLGIGHADHERNPLRTEIIGTAVYRGICSTSKERESRQLIAREMGLALARVIPGCYADIIKDFKARGVLPVALSVRGVDGPGNELARDRVISGYSTLPRDSGYMSGPVPLGGSFASHSEFGAAAEGGTPTGSGRGGSGAAAGPGAGHGGAGGGNWSGSGAGRAPGAASGASPPARGGGYGPTAASPADAELMTLIRRLTVLATRPADLGGSSTHSTGSGASGLGAASTRGGGYGDGLTRPMAINLIRAHRDELRQVSHGALDHMLIDVVGSLFDQILSDPRVPPHMARQIARLQLPVLRVALSDNTFFSSRKHPVRRFVNRIASLACAFEDFDHDPGKQVLARVRELVQEIVDGDFDQIDVYSAKLAALENFITQQGREDVQAASSAASVVDAKESDLRLQQRYMLQLQSALNPLGLQGYLQDFLSQVWSQSMAFATKREGPQSELVQRLRRVARDLVMSVQPKGSPAMRKKFLMQLPSLMKDLNEGMKLIGWPEAAQKEFFGKLLPAHADSLKAAALTELEYNLLAKQLEGIFNTPLPETDSLLRDSHVGGIEALEPQFSATEAQQIGLVQESAIDWSGQIDIDLDASDAGPETVPSGATLEGDVTTPAALSDADHSGDSSGSGVDLNLNLGPGLDINLSPTEPPEPTKGLQLMDHVRIGFAYQMHLNDEWQKVRLSYVSPGRAFFVFTRGTRHHETVSLTARMLARMCETGRFKAFESAYLIERATQRARKQLAELSVQHRH